jgi:hypothetical protein
MHFRMNSFLFRININFYLRRNLIFLNLILIQRIEIQHMKKDTNKKVLIDRTQTDSEIGNRIITHITISHKLLMTLLLIHNFFDEDRIEKYSIWDNGLPVKNQLDDSS